jgi:hypothetical protein
MIGLVDEHGDIGRQFANERFDFFARRDGAGGIVGVDDVHESSGSAGTVQHHGEIVLVPFVERNVRDFDAERLACVRCPPVRCFLRLSVARSESRSLEPGSWLERNHLHRPTVIRRGGRCIGAPVASQLVLNEIAVEGRTGSKARTHRAGRVGNAVTVDHVASHGRRGVAARDRASAARGTRLGINGIRLIHPRVFG